MLRISWSLTVREPVCSINWRLIDNTVSNIRIDTAFNHHGFCVIGVNVALCDSPSYLFKTVLRREIITDSLETAFDNSGVISFQHIGCLFISRFAPSKRVSAVVRASRAS